DNFVLIGPGNVFARARISENSSSSIHSYRSTTSRYIKGIADNPPSYPSIPARKNAINRSLCTDHHNPLWVNSHDRLRQILPTLHVNHLIDYSLKTTF